MQDIMRHILINSSKAYSNNASQTLAEDAKHDLPRTAIGGISQRNAGHDTAADPAGQAREGSRLRSGGARTHGIDNGPQDLRPHGEACAGVGGELAGGDRGGSCI